MILHTFPKGDTDAEKLMDACISNIDGFRSGYYHEGIGSFLADDNHGVITWDALNIWVQTIDSIDKVSIQAVIDTL